MRELSCVLLCLGLVALGCSSDDSKSKGSGGSGGGGATTDGGETGGSAPASSGGKSGGKSNGGAAGKATTASGGAPNGGTAGSAGTGGAGGAGGDCFALPLVDHVRLYPAAGKAAAMKGGKIMGSNTSQTDGFVEVVAITAAPKEGEWVELSVASPKAYRYLKYYGPAANRGDVAELEFYAGKVKAPGKAFGTQPESAATGADAAFDGDTATFYRGTVDNDQYVGLDLAADHVVATPTIAPLGGTFDTAPTVTLKSDTPGAVIRYTTNGSDPAMGTEYKAPFKVFSTSTVKVVGTAKCMLNSGTAQAVFNVGSMSPNAVSSFHLGNSLTGPVITALPDLVSSQKKFTLEFHQCVTAGVDVQNFWSDNPPPGCYDLPYNPLKPAPGQTVADPKVALADATMLPPIDNLVVQPFAAVTCTPFGEKGDGAFANDFYQLAKTKNNPNVRLWIYATWSAPTATNWSNVDCFANGAGAYAPSWPGDSVKLGPVTDWESATKNHMLFHESVRSEVDKANGVDPSDPSTPGQHALIVPVGLALINLKHEVEAGKVHGIAAGDFFKVIYGQNGTDLHISYTGGYFDACVYYAAFYKTSPEGLPGNMGASVTNEMALDFQRIAWQTVTEYKWSGLN